MRKTQKTVGAIGMGMKRVDAWGKVTGETRYLGDMDCSGVLHGVVVRSPKAHGILKGIRLRKDFDWRGVTVATAADIPGENVVHMHDRSMPLMGAVGAEIRYCGEPVAVVAAQSEEKALAAAAAVEVDVEEIPALLTLGEAVEIFKGASAGKLEYLKEQTIEKGNLQAGFAAADHVIEREYRAGHQEQLYLEPQGLRVTPQGKKGILVEGSIQCPYFPATELNSALKLTTEQIRVRQTPMGGAFGGKEDYPSMLAGYAAVAALKARKAVQIQYGRHEDLQFTPKRHPVWVRYRIGYRDDGTLTAIDCDYLLDGGAYLTISDVVMYRGILHCALAYRCENVLVKGKVVRTNSMPCGAFRGFGAPQAIWGLESAVDEIAELLGIRPDLWRKRNQVRPGDRTSTGQKLTDENGTREVLDLVLKRSGFAEKWRKSTRGKVGKDGKLRGVGLSFFGHGSAFTGDGEAHFKAKGRVNLARLEDGKAGLEIRVSSTEMGQGVHTIFTQIASDATGVGMERIRFPLADTGLVPNSGPTVASRTTMVVGNVVWRAGQDLKGQLEAYAGAAFFRGGKAKLEGGEFVGENGKRVPFLKVGDAALKDGKALSGFFEFLLPTTTQWDQTTFKGDAYPGYSWSADVAEVEVDPNTYELNVSRVWSVLDIGRVINPVLATGQVEGGLTQALGYATMERIQTGKNGLYDATRLQTYIVPTALDVPKWDVKFVEYPYQFAPPGGKGLGEMPMDGLAPAIANAIEAATGKRLRELPLTPESIFTAMTSGGGER